MLALTQQPRNSEGSFGFCDFVAMGVPMGPTMWMV